MYSLLDCWLTEPALVLWPSIRLPEDVSPTFYRLVPFLVLAGVLEEYLS